MDIDGNIWGDSAPEVMCEVYIARQWEGLSAKLEYLDYDLNLDICMIIKIEAL